jgi:hypothetical protein
MHVCSPGNDLLYAQKGRAERHRGWTLFGFQGETLAKNTAQVV